MFQSSLTTKVLKNFFLIYLTFYFLKSSVYYKNVYCKNHSRLKSNIVQLIDKPFHVPLYKKNLSKKEIDKYYFDFINSEEYDFVENKGFYYKKKCYLTNKALIAKENINKLKIKKSTIIMI